MSNAALDHFFEDTDLSSETEHLNGAAIVDAQGREIPITESMIRDALELLESEGSLMPQPPSR